MDSEALKIQLWADDGERTDPEDVGLDRDDGWTVAYEQVASGFEPERVVFNQMFRELTGWARDRMKMGIPTWDPRVNYRHPAFVAHDARIYKSILDTGPVAGNSAAPAPDSQVWQVY